MGGGSEGLRGGRKGTCPTAPDGDDPASGDTACSGDASAEPRGSGEKRRGELPAGFDALRRLASLWLGARRGAEDGGEMPLRGAHHIVSSDTELPRLGARRDLTASDNPRYATTSPAHTDKMAPTSTLRNAGSKHAFVVERLQDMCITQLKA